MLYVQRGLAVVMWVLVVVEVQPEQLVQTAAQELGDKVVAPQVPGPHPFGMALPPLGAGQLVGVVLRPQPGFVITEKSTNAAPSRR